MTEKLNTIEKIGLAFVFSIALDISIGLFLGYNETMKNLTGGITVFNVWVYLSAITLMLLIINTIVHIRFKKSLKKSLDLKNINP